MSEKRDNNKEDESDEEDLRLNAMVESAAAADQKLQPVPKEEVNKLMEQAKKSHELENKQKKTADSNNKKKAT
ncbi:unnamed protein product [Bursaphelenchus okinawaensis]|uniref:Uncharacterized protein n=1 Tax=Bursaphelenchus okinawaensis TaxID=465554 RepID=A0A811K5F4_9BILA|nr:unnamed protein product [Bursaphelenchus okinawaensis]CAG9091751.1 unnamed protein product [Bursaphelenchus okinawaensis]